MSSNSDDRVLVCWLANHARRQAKLRVTIRARFWIEGVLAGLCAFLAVLTWLWGDWIEAVTSLSPDGHGGSFEWKLVLGLCGLCLVAGLAAGGEWVRMGAEQGGAASS
jgi:hypothetical protein